MAKVKLPKKPRLGASALSWQRYEQRMDKYVKHQNELKRRKTMKEDKLAKIKI